MDNLSFKKWVDYREETQPNEGFNDSSDYLNPGSETEVRNQLQSLHSQTKDFINTNILPVLSESVDLEERLVARIAPLENHEIASMTGDGNITIEKTGKNYRFYLNVSPTGEVSKEYVDRMDASTLDDAEAYTATYYTENIGTAIQTAEDYADAQDVTTLNSAKSYSDSNLNNAKSDATTKANNALSSAKSYSDGNLATAKSYSDANLVTAKNYTDSKLGGGISVSDISISRTPSSISRQSWDTNSEYLYYIDVTVSGMTTSMYVSNFACSTGLLDRLAPIVETRSNALRIFCKGSSSLSGTIMSIVARAV